MDKKILGAIVAGIIAMIFAVFVAPLFPNNVGPWIFALGLVLGNAIAVPMVDKTKSISDGLIIGGIACLFAVPIMLAVWGK